MDFNKDTIKRSTAKLRKTFFSTLIISGERDIVHILFQVSDKVLFPRCKQFKGLTHCQAWHKTN